MSDYCLFDQLPVELLHAIFHYFSASELLFTFHNVNDYINATLESYTNYQLNFKSISMFHFRRICRHVRPEQVVSLTLSDANDTSGQSELFFSYFQIEQFIRLQSLTLVEIEFNSLKCIFTNLHKLRQLRAFSFDDQSIRYQYSPQDKPVPSYPIDVNKSVLSQLNCLHLNNDAMLRFIPFPHLRNLNLRQCRIDELNTIFQHTPQLKSLSVSLNFNGSKLELVFPPNQLTQLNLQIRSKYVIFERRDSFLYDR
jgi:hypothetical protein